MAVLDSNQTVSKNRNGFDKKISDSARTMMLDNVQNFMYQKPIPSCVRETVSNCIDATNEKLVALKILSGEVDVKSVYKTLEDVEVSKDEDNIYQDSEFKAEYYKPEWLSDNNQINIQYTCNPVYGERDMFSISDNGVGIGDSRLEGVFSIGFSSKRLNTNEIGGFGLGQKSALATGVASYRMTTRHNGKKFTFDIFSHKIENVISKWNDDGTSNPYVEFTNTWMDEVDPQGNLVKVFFKAYYTPTEEKNGTTIEFEVKPHNRQQFIDAVKSQMMYLKDDVVFTMTDIYGNNQNIPFKADPIYEDDNIILSNYGYYNRPHFVIKGFAYGLIDFAEAELSPKFGNMGFKFNMEDLDVLPSREGVRYTPKTTAAIVSIYDKNAATVKRMLSEELSETKFLPWLKTANKIANRAGSGNSQDVVSRLSALTDQSELDFNFNDDFKYSSSFKSIASPLLNLQIVGNNHGKIKREDSDYTTSLKGDGILFQFESSSSRKTAYLLVSHQELTLIKTNNNYKYLNEAFGKYVAGCSLESVMEIALEAVDANEIDDIKRKNIKAYLDRAFKFLTLLLVDDAIPSYDAVEVPEDFKISEEVAESDVAEAMADERYKKILAERKANREFYIQKFKISSVWSNLTKLSRELVKFSDLDALQSAGTKLVYFTEDSNDELKRLISHANVTNSHNPLDNDKLLVFKIAKSNLKQVVPIGESLEDWFFNVEDDVVNFAPLIQDALKNKRIWNMSVSWVNDSKLINEGIHTKISKLKSLHRAHASFAIGVIINEVVELQDLLLAVDGDAEHVTVKTKLQKFKTKYKLNENVTNIKGADKSIIQLTAECEDFNAVYGTFLNHVNIKKISAELEMVLQAKKDQLQFKFKGLHDDDINS